MTSKEFIDTICLCKDFNISYNKGYEILVTSDFDLYKYCKDFMVRLNIKCDYTDLIETVLILLEGKNGIKQISVKDYLYKSLKYLDTIKWLIPDDIKDITDIQKYLKLSTLEFFDNSLGLKNLIKNEDCIIIDGKDYLVEQCEKNDENGSYAQFLFDGKETNIGAIFIKDKKFEFVKVNSNKDELDVLKRMLTQDDSFDIVITPILNCIDFKEEDLRKLLVNNSMIIEYSTFMNEGYIKNGRDISNVVEHIRNSEIDIFDFYNALPSTANMSCYLRLFDIILSVLESLPDKKREKLKKHILKVLKFRAYEDDEFNDDILLIVDNIYGIRDITIENFLWMLKDGNIAFTDILNEMYGYVDIYEDGDEDKRKIDELLNIRDIYSRDTFLENDTQIVLYDLRKRIHKFNIGDKDLIEMIKNQEYLFIQAFYGELFEPGKGWTSSAVKISRRFKNIIVH